MTGRYIKCVSQFHTNGWRGNEKRDILLLPGPLRERSGQLSCLKAQASLNSRLLKVILTIQVSVVTKGGTVAATPPQWRKPPTSLLLFVVSQV